MCLGIPAQVVEITDQANKLAWVEIAGVRRMANLACIVDESHPIETCLGDWVLLHVGFAMSRMDETEAAKTLELLTELGEAQQQLDEMWASGS